MLNAGVWTYADESLALGLLRQTNPRFNENSAYSAVDQNASAKWRAADRAQHGRSWVEDNGLD